MELFEQIRREYEFGIGTIARGGEETESSSANGAGSDWQPVADTAEESATTAVETGGGHGVR